MDMDEHQDALHTKSAETEVTIGSGNLFAIFFGIVILCAVFFGWGYKIGLKSAASPEFSPPSAPKSSHSTPMPKPSAVPVPSDNPPSQIASQPAPPENKQSATISKPTGSAATSAPELKPSPSGGNFVVQVAAVSKQEDADALV